MSVRRKFKARARRKFSSSGGMNGLEAEYAAHLRRQMNAGELIYFAFEPITLRLAPRTTYTPDFLVINATGEVEFHETKGFWRDDARVKFKVAANAFPFFAFVAIQRDARVAGGWRFERI